MPKLGSWEVQLLGPIFFYFWVCGRARLHYWVILLKILFKFFSVFCLLPSNSATMLGTHVTQKLNQLHFKF